MGQDCSGSSKAFSWAVVTSSPSFCRHSLPRVGSIRTLPGLSMAWCCGLNCLEVIRPGGKRAWEPSQLYTATGAGASRKKEWEGSEGVFCRTWLDVTLLIGRGVCPKLGSQPASVAMCFEHWALNFHIRV